MAHLDELQHHIMKKMNPAIVALSEARLTDDNDDSEVNVSGYSLIRCNAENKFTGGVVLYVRDNIKYDIVLKDKTTSNCWFVAIEVRMKGFRETIMIIYHSPKAADREFLNFLEDKIERLIIKGKCIVLRDFNINFMTKSFYAEKLRISMNELGMKQYVNGPTRITKDSQTMIDLVFANNEVNVSVKHSSKIADHAWLQIEIDMKKLGGIFKTFVGRDYSKFNTDDLLNLLENKIVQGQGLCVNVRADRFINSIVDSLNMMAPRKLFKIPRVWEGKK